MNRLFRSLILSALIAVIPATSFGAMSLQEANTLGQNLGIQNRNEVGTSGISEETASQVPFYKKNPAQENGYQGGVGDMVNIGVGRITQSQQYSPGRCDLEGFDPAAEAQKSAGPAKWAAMTPAQQQRAIQAQSDYFDQECEGINFLAGEYQTRPKIEIPPDDSLQDWRPPAGSPDDSSCVIQETTTPDEFVMNACYESRTIEKRFCREDLVISCQSIPFDGCEPAGVVPGTNMADTKTSLYPSGNGYWNLEFGSIGDNYWSGGSGTAYNRTLYIDINEVLMTTEFRLVRVDFDDWYMLKVNGVVIYNGPFGGDRLELVNRQYCASTDYETGECIRYATRRQVQYGPNSFGPPERSTSHVQSLNINILPYLHNGRNVIESRTIVGGGGEMFTRFRVKARCPCDYHWVNNCASFEDAASGENENRTFVVSNITASPATAIANGQDTSVVKAYVTDDQGVPARAGYTVFWSGGVSGTSQTDENGLAQIVIPSRAAPAAMLVTAKASDKDTGQAITVSFTQDLSNMKMAVTAEPSSLKADGIETTTILAQVLDGSGNPVQSRVPVIWNTTLGTFVTADEATSSTGLAEAVLQSENAGTAIVTASTVAEDGFSGTNGSVSVAFIEPTETRGDANNEWTETTMSCPAPEMPTDPASDEDDDSATEPDDASQPEADAPTVSCTMLHIEAIWDGATVAEWTSEESLDGHYQGIPSSFSVDGYSYTKGQRFGTEGEGTKAYSITRARQ